MPKNIVNFYHKIQLVPLTLDKSGIKFPNNGWAQIRLNLQRKTQRSGQVHEHQDGQLHKNGFSTFFIRCKERLSISWSSRGLCERKCSQVFYVGKLGDKEDIRDRI